MVSFCNKAFLPLLSLVVKFILEKLFWALLVAANGLLSYNLSWKLVFLFLKFLQPSSPVTLINCNLTILEPLIDTISSAHPSSIRNSITAFGFYVIFKFINYKALPSLANNPLVAWFGLLGFYGISTIVGYLMPNSIYTDILNIYDL